MPMGLISADSFRDEAKSGGRPDGTVFRLATGDSQTVGDVADRTERFVFSDGTVDLAGDAIAPKGWQTDDFERNPVALFSHMSWEPPIGRAHNVGVKGGKLIGDIEFASADIYEFADTIYRLVRGKFLKAVSVGFKPLDWAFSTDKDRPYGIDFKKQSLLEISVCCVPCNPNALVEARSAGIDTRPLVGWAEKVLDTGGCVLVPKAELEQLRRTAKEPASRQQKTADWKCGASRDLPIDTSSTWDGGEAEASIFEHAGGDDFDPAKAKLGFLAYDASAPKLRGSYKLPFAHVVNGEMKAVGNGIHAAASRLSSTEIPEHAKSAAQAVIDHYEAEMKKSKAVGEVGSGAALVSGNCGRGKDAECGMKDPAECAMHAPETKAVLATLKAGRAISAKNAAVLNQAIEHMANSTKCIKDVLAAEDPADEQTENPSEPNDDIDPTQRRLRAVQALKDQLKL